MEKIVHEGPMPAPKRQQTFFEVVFTWRYHLLAPKHFFLIVFIWRYHLLAPFIHKHLYDNCCIEFIFKCFRLICSTTSIAALTHCQRAFKAFTYLQSIVLPILSHFSSYFKCKYLFVQGYINSKKKTNKIESSWVSNPKFSLKYSPVTITPIPRRQWCFLWKLPAFRSNCMGFLVTQEYHCPMYTLCTKTILDLMKLLAIQNIAMTTSLWSHYRSMTDEQVFWRDESCLLPRSQTTTSLPSLQTFKKKENHQNQPGL